MTLAGERHAAEQRVRAAAGTDRLVQVSAIPGITDTRAEKITSIDRDAQENVARFLADVPSPGHARRSDQTPPSLQPSEPVVHEREHDSGYGL